MSRKSHQKTIEQASIISGLCADLISIGSWILGLISTIALISQEQSVKFPGINIPLDADYQFALLVSAVLAYIHFLQNHWEELRSKGKVHVPCTIFVLYEIPIFKHPLLLIPFIFFFILGYKVTRSHPTLETIFSWIILGIIVAVVLAFKYHYGQSDSWNHNYYEHHSTDSWKADDETKTRWIQRIRKKLDDHGTVSTEDFFNELALHPYEYDQINWALYAYFSEFEFQENLTISPPTDLLYFVEDIEYVIQSQTLVRRGSIANKTA